MNALTTTRHAGALSIPASLETAVRLAAEQTRRYGAGADDPGFVIHLPYQPTEAEIAAARATLPALADTMRPVTRKQLRDWLFTLNSAVRNPQSQDAFELRLAAFSTALTSYPALAFTPETLGEAMGKFAFFPSFADLKALLDAWLEPTRRTIDAVERIAASAADTPAEPKPQPTARGARTAEQIAHVARAVRTVRKEAAQRRAPPRDAAKPAVPSAYLAGDALAAARETAGIPTPPANGSAG